MRLLGSHWVADNVERARVVICQKQLGGSSYLFLHYQYAADYSWRPVECICEVTQNVLRWNIYLLKLWLARLNDCNTRLETSCQRLDDYCASIVIGRWCARRKRKEIGNWIFLRTCTVAQVILRAGLSQRKTNFYLFFLLRLRHKTNRSEIKKSALRHANLITRWSCIFVALCYSDRFWFSFR